MKEKKIAKAEFMAYEQKNMNTITVYMEMIKEERDSIDCWITSIFAETIRNVYSSILEVSTLGAALKREEAATILYDSISSALSQFYDATLGRADQKFTHELNS